ncbi:fibronectin type III domain-containing protein [Carboxylicivirga marina]|uniref:SusE outer membrane protein domain-containing protein n=1 Tax=Carboxylicivirga marina TaxID=2800988 RepID=A0ABS1HEY0_9BACT|nr:hypothetical protein [Carboxylicivirga marina]MBK3516166.1 hypothetical protein [Carboxylicivirga marina]
MIRKNIFLALLTITIGFAGCEEEYTIGDFETDATLAPEARTDGPVAPSAIVASYDAFCDKVEINWMPTVRTTAYDVYKNGEILAAGLTDTFYVDTDAMTVDTEYMVYSLNANGGSETSVMTVGRMAATPPTPTNFIATDGAYEAKVDLTWDAVDFAQHYIVKRDGVVLSDAVIGTSFSDSDNAPTEATEYSLIAVSVCGVSIEVTTTGYCDPLIAFRFPFQENFEGFTLGALTSADQYGGFNPRFQFTDGPNANGSATIKDDNTKYIDLKTAAGKQSIQFVFPEVELLVGESYRISFDVKAPQTISLHMGVDKTGDGFMGKYVDDYLLPTKENTKNGNAYGVNIEGTGSWKTVSYEFPQTGAETQDNDPDAGTMGWTLGTIQEGQQRPIIQLQMWSKDGTYAIDNIKIELID